MNGKIYADLLAKIGMSDINDRDFAQLAHFLRSLLEVEEEWIVMGFVGLLMKHVIVKENGGLSMGNRKSPCQLCYKQKSLAWDTEHGKLCYECMYGDDEWNGAIVIVAVMVEIVGRKNELWNLF